MELVIKTSTQGVKNGTIAQYLHSPSSGKPITLGSWGYSGEPTPKYPAAMNYGTNYRYRWFLWQNYRGNGISAMKVWMDDLYVQVGSVARVEIGDSATWGNCTFREIQPYKAWTDSSVQVTLNKGGMKAGTQYYMYIVDNTGTPSNAFPVQLGGNVSPPAAPSLQVTN
jgi:hypothetical protein